MNKSSIESWYIVNTCAEDSHRQLKQKSTIVAQQWVVNLIQNL